MRRYRWDQDLRFTSRRRVSLKGAAVLLVLSLWLISFASQGFVGIASWLLQGWASMSWVERLSALLAGSGFLILTASPALRRFWGAGLAGILGISLLLIGLVAYGGAYAVTVNDNPQAISVTHLKSPIDTTSSRLVPLHTAYAYAISMLQTPTHTVYEDETYVYYNREDRIIYNWIIEPEGFWNRITRNPVGVVLVNGSIYPPEVLVVKHNLHWGLHRYYLTPLYLDTLWREIKLKAGLSTWVMMECNVEVLYKGVPYILIPLATWEVGPITTLPVPFGYAVVFPNGSINVVSLRQAAGNPLFHGVPLVPDVIAREWVEAYRYFTGIWNVMLYHNTYTIRDVGTNPQPYLMSDSSGHLYWVFIAEPPGATYSAKYIFYVNASDPRPHVMIYELPKPVLGISKIASLIKQAHPTYDWGEFNVEEPMPIILNGTLYWKVTVITKDGRGLVSIDLVNTQSNEVSSLTPNKTLSMAAVVNYLLGIKPNQTTSPNTTLGEVLQKINQLKKQIASQEKELHRLYEELEVLESLVQRLATNESMKP